MKISEANWMQIEEYLKKDNRCVVPIGSTEQHAYLSLATDSILAEKISVDAAEPLGVPVLPVMPFGHTPMFMEFPGTIDLKLDTLNRVMIDILDSLRHHGFRKILIVNGHGGNMPVEDSVNEWVKSKADMRVKFHNWFRAPKTWAKTMEIDPVASHASWMENFEWTRLPGLIQPREQKPMVDLKKLSAATAVEARKMLGDGSWGGLYQRSDADTDALWDVAVRETRDLIEFDWG
jgi:creatinine amidohydrolase